MEELLGNATTEIVGNEKIIDGTSEQNKGADKETEDVQPCLESENNDKDAEVSLDKIPKELKLLLGKRCNGIQKIITNLSRILLVKEQGTQILAL